MSSKKRARNESSYGTTMEQVQNMEQYRIQGMQHADVFYAPDFVEKSTAAEWYHQLFDLWYQPKLKVFGKEVIQSRKIAAYATDPKLTLKYSGQVVDMQYEYPPLLRKIQDVVEGRLGVTFNHVMLNLYEDGNVYIGNHRDNPENRIIASLSLGAPRAFIMSYNPLQSGQRQRKKARTISSDYNHPGLEDLGTGVAWRKRIQLTLDPGSLVVMQGETQNFWKHEIPKEPKIAEGRISLTFRQLDC